LHFFKVKVHSAVRTCVGHANFILKELLNLHFRYFCILILFILQCGLICSKKINFLFFFFYGACFCRKDPLGKLSRRESETKRRRQRKERERSNEKMDQQWMAIRNLKDTLVVQPNFELKSVPINFKVYYVNC
jgi:hypothetical protein